MPSNYSKNRYKNIDVGGTGALQLPVGTTSQRPGSAGAEIATASAGQIRFNSTTSRLEQFTGASWIAVDAPPTVTGISPSQIAPSAAGPSGTLLTISGTRFGTGASVLFGTTTAATITVVNENTITCRAPSGITTGYYTVEVINTSGLSSKLVDGFAVDTPPVWTTPVGTVGTVTNGQAITTITLVASDADAGATITYAITSGALPTGLNLNSANGQITGTPSGYTSETAVSFTVRATGTQVSGISGTTDRSFSITVRPAATISSLSASSGSPGDTLTISGTNFFGTPTVTIGGTSATVTSSNSTSINCTVPASLKVNTGIGKETQTGGTNWFDANTSYYGVYPSYRLQNGVTYRQIRYRLPTTSSTSGRFWWAIAFTKGTNTEYTIRFAARLEVPSGNNGDIVTQNFSAAATKIGFDGDNLGFTVPSSGDYFIGWMSGAGTGNGSNPGGSFWSDSASEQTGLTQYVQSNTAPSTTGTVITMSNSNTAGQMHIQWLAPGYNVAVSNPAVTVNSVTQTPSGITAGSTYRRNFVTTAYSYTGSDQNFVVPAGITLVEAKLWGAGGGGGNRGGWDYGSDAGAGGFTFSSIATTPGETLKVVVGIAGDASPKRIGLGYGGAGGGGSDNGDNRYSGCGGGYAGIFRSTVSHGNSLAIAGAGGGGGSSRNGNTCRGGAGGGADGERGSAGQGTAGGGGTQSAGGDGGSYGLAGSALAGGNSPSSHPYGGDGGGGYYGGGSGGYAEPNGMNGGGGGSGYITAQSVGKLAAGTGGTRNPREQNDPDYSAGIGVAGGGSTDSGLSDGGAARVVIRY